MAEPTTQELVNALGMDEEERQWADEFYEAIQIAANATDRAEQAAAHVVGVSDLGFCSERLRRTLLRIEPEDTDMLAAWIGTALGDHAERAILARFPDMVRQATVTLSLDINGKTYNIPGHPDLIDPVHGILWDAKTDFGFSVVRRTGPSEQQQFQRHGYALAAHRAGMFGDRPLAEIKVGNFWIDRSGVEKNLHVQLEPFDMEWVNKAAEWLDEVIYAYRETSAGRPTEARKEPPREMCAVVCGHYRECRQDDTDVEGLLTDPEVLTALDMYAEGMEANRVGKKLQEEAKAHLTNIQGRTGASPGDKILRWTWVNETTQPAATRRGYWKIDVKEVKETKSKAPRRRTTKAAPTDS